MTKWVNSLLLLVAVMGTPQVFANGPSAHCESLLVAQYPHLVVAEAPRQSSDNIDTLYAQAEAALPAFKRFVHSIAQATGTAPEHVGLKTKESLATKASLRKKGDASRVLDIARAALIADNLDQVYSTLTVIEAMAGEFGVQMLKVKDRFATPSDTGYRDLHLNMRVAGHIVEVQIHLKPLYALKKAKGDALYKEIMKLEAEKSPENETRVKELREEHKKLFDETFRGIQFSPAA